MQKRFPFRDIAYISIILLLGFVILYIVLHPEGVMRAKMMRTRHPELSEADWYRVALQLDDRGAPIPRDVFGEADIALPLGYRLASGIMEPSRTLARDATRYQRLDGRLKHIAIDGHSLYLAMQGGGADIAYYRIRLEAAQPTAERVEAPSFRALLAANRVAHPLSPTGGDW